MGLAAGAYGIFPHARALSWGFSEFHGHHHCLIVSFACDFLAFSFSVSVSVLVYFLLIFFGTTPNCA